ncbi:MAG TPA: ester cyclase [Thermoleophilaceae bacterium]
MTTLEQDHKVIARRALEEVCARGDFAKAEQFYSPSFRDHVNELEFHGLEGVRKSVGLYRSVFPDLEIEVVDQVIDGDEVASRWVARGSNRGRRATLEGITISRIEDGKIVEDWTVSDNVGMLRRLGLWRTLRLLAAQARDRLSSGSREA